MQGNDFSGVDLKSLLRAKGVAEQKQASASMLPGTRFSSSTNRLSNTPIGAGGDGMDTLGLMRIQQGGPNLALLSLLNNIEGYSSRLSPGIQAEGSDRRYHLGAMMELNRKREMEDLALAKMKADLANARMANRPRASGAGATPSSSYLRSQRDPLMERLQDLSARENARMLTNQRRMSDLQVGDRSQMSRVRRGVIDDGVISELIRSLLNG